MDAIATASMWMVMVMVMMNLVLPSHSFVFDLQSGRTKCISEDLRVNVVAVGHYKIAVDPPHHYKISARVSGPYGDSIHLEDSVESGEFAFTAVQSGEHIICFWSPHFELSAKFPVEFQWKTGITAKDWTGVAKKDMIDNMGLELKKLEETVHAIHEEMMFLREREEEMQKLNETTNKRMASMSILSLFMCLGVAGLQLWHLKGFFERKKVL